MKRMTTRAIVVGIVAAFSSVAAAAGAAEVQVAPSAVPVAPEPQRMAPETAAPEVQNTTIYAAGIGAAARDTTAAKALIDHLAGPAAATVLKAKGMEKP